MQYHIPEKQWKEIYKELQKNKSLHIKNEEETRLFIEAIWLMMRSGMQWRLLPESYGYWNSVYKRFANWSQKGVFEDLFESCKKDADTDYVMIDATIVRAHACASGYKKDSQTREALGRSVGGFTTKINALVDALGYPLKFILSPGQEHDVKAAPQLIEGIYDTNLIADKGYDSDDLIEIAHTQNCSVTIPSRRSRITARDYDFFVYKERHLIECFFGKLKHFRRLFSRFDKSARNFMSFLYFASFLIWLR